MRSIRTLLLPVLLACLLPPTPASAASAPPDCPQSPWCADDSFELAFAYVNATGRVAAEGADRASAFLRHAGIACSLEAGWQVNWTDRAAHARPACDDAPALECLGPVLTLEKEGPDRILRETAHEAFALGYNVGRGGWNVARAPLEATGQGTAPVDFAEGTFYGQIDPVHDAGETGAMAALAPVDGGDLTLIAAATCAVDGHARSSDGPATLGSPNDCLRIGGNGVGIGCAG